MRTVLRFLRKMNVILFMCFLVYSFIFITLISTLDNYNWKLLFDNFQNKDLQKSAYLIMDDMRNEGIKQGPLTNDQRAWLSRRAAIYGISLRFESQDKKQLWFDTFANGKTPDADSVKELPYLAGGRQAGFLSMAYIIDNNELDPAYVDFQQTVKFRSRLLFTVVILLSVIFSFITAKRLSKPLHNVYDLATQIGIGKRDVTIPVKGPEEVRRLAATLNEMTTELKKQEDWRHHLMEDLTHELRTPLTSMLSQIEAIVDGVYEADTERMQDIYEELIRLSRLVNDLERLSEAESARFTLNIRRTNMVLLARRVYNNFHSVARSKNIRLNFESTNVPCYAEVDRDKVVQVLSNLVLNAIKYTPDGGKVKLGVDWNTDHTILYCMDNGSGISEKDLPYIFNRLYRADKSRSRFSGGVGLGLCIAKALVEAHNGTIEATSQMGVGSTFTVYLPNVFDPYVTEEE
ncbi:MAG: two-component system sensor histidine kinase [Paenibacillaceae bacterium]|jgi:signal transduction histidine kinase|nr:two-component system sensor histidine kinase [Paenibacillaceae bacterium]